MTVNVVVILEVGGPSCRRDTSGKLGGVALGVLEKQEKQYVIYSFPNLSPPNLT